MSKCYSNAFQSIFPFVYHVHNSLLLQQFAVVNKWKSGPIFMLNEIYLCREIIDMLTGLRFLIDIDDWFQCNYLLATAYRWIRSSWTHSQSKYAIHVQNVDSKYWRTNPWNPKFKENYSTVNHRRCKKIRNFSNLFRISYSII